MGFKSMEDDDRSPLLNDSPISYNSIEDDADRLLSVAEIARRPGESLYSKKCLLVNAEIDRMGMVSRANDASLSLRHI